jgi:hypothetical protein
MYASDPAFNNLDHEFLNECNIKVVQKEAPATPGFITPSTFLFAPFCPWSVAIGQLMVETTPALYVGNDLKATRTVVEMLHEADIDPKSRAEAYAVIDRLLYDWGTCEWPIGDAVGLEKVSFEGSMIYWKRT